MPISFNPFVPSIRTGGPAFNPSLPFSGSANNCAPVSIYNQFGVLISTVVSGGSYQLNPNFFDLEFTFPAGARLYRAYVQPFEGTLSLLTLPANLTSFELRIVVGSVTTLLTQANLPISVAVNKRDVLSFEGVPTSPGSSVTTLFRIDYDSDASVNTTSVLGGDGRYLTVLNGFDQTASVIDVTLGASSVGAVIATPALAAGKDFRSGDFRTSDLKGYIFGSSWYATVDLDPLSGTFGTIITSAATVTGTNMVACCYAPPFDTFILGGTGTGQTYQFVPGTGVSSNIGTWLGNSATNGTTRLTYINSLRAFVSYTELGVLMRIVSIDDQFVMNVSSIDGGILREFRGRLYGGFTSSLKVFRMVPLLKQITSTTTGSVLRGGVAFVASLNRAYFTDYTEKKICVVNCVNNAVLGTITGWAGVGAGCRDIQYCPYNGLLYAQASDSSGLTGVNRIYVFDPNAGSFGQFVDFITVGNMYSAADYYSNQMFFNSIQQ